jgi:hypothetical protein
MVYNGVITSAAMLFLAIWRGSKARVNKVTAQIQNYLWMSENHSYHSWIAWPTCCLKKRDGGLGMVDPAEAVISLMCKWIITAIELGSSNFKRLLRYRLSMFQPYASGNWSPNLLWFIFPHHPARMDSKIWERTVRSR